MVRRIGFGDGTRAEKRRRSVLHPDGEPEQAGEAGAPAAEAEAADGAAAPRKRAGPLARAAGLLFLLAWLAGWSYGIWFAFSAIAELWTAGPADGFDWAMLAFFAVWLIGALVGWAFGVVILFVLLFGKSVTPEQKAEKLRRRLARLEARQRDG